MPAGASGGITSLGTGATLAGGLAMGLVAWGLAATFGSGVGAWWVALAGLGACLVGSLADSLLGATVQAQYRDAAGAITERAGGIRARGVPWMTNDMVNLLASLLGGAVAAGIGTIFS